MTTIRLGILAGDPFLESNAQLTASSIRRTTGFNPTLVDIEGPRHDSPSTFDDIEKWAGARRKTQLEALAAGEVDLLLTRAADWPLEAGETLMVCAALQRPAIPTATLVTRPGLAVPTHADPIGLPAASRVGVTSAAAEAQILARRPDLEVVAAAVNVVRRNGCLEGQGLDACLVQTQALDHSQDDDTKVELSQEALLPSGHDDALVILGRPDGDVRSGLEDLHQNDAFRQIETERIFLSLLHRDVRRNVTCLATITHGHSLRLQTCFGSRDPKSASHEISRVGSSAGDPKTAAMACFRALSAIRPEVIP